jgi:carbon-monoxide dehydrogenase catalytic subunit
VEGEIPFAKRVPEKPWRPGAKHGIVPGGAMREIMELMHRTHMGVDQHYENITKQCSRTALADGWGGSMVATEISDILFGTPTPVAVDVNMGVLKEDQVNIIVHGHEPNLFESMLVSVNDPMILGAESQGCRCQGHQPGGHVLLRRRGDVAARHSPCRQLHVHRAVLVTGAVDAMCVDVQCIKQGLVKWRTATNAAFHHQPALPHRRGHPYRVP